jgi:predicted transcriptional regulator
MKSVEIEVLRPKAALQAFKRAWRQAERGEAVMSRLAFGSWAEVFSAITEKRVELIRYVIGHERMNTRQLGQALGRDYKNVYTDVQALVQIGLLDKDSRGRISAPFDEIVIRAELRDALKTPRHGGGSDLRKIDAHVITREEYEESPELGPEFFEQADEFQGGKLVQRGRRPSDAPSSSRTVGSSGRDRPRSTKRR